MGTSNTSNEPAFQVGYQLAATLQATHEVLKKAPKALAVVWIYVGGEECWTKGVSVSGVQFIPHGPDGFTAIHDHLAGDPNGPGKAEIKMADDGVIEVSGELIPGVKAIMLEEKEKSEEATNAA